jgi:hypothetical protein
MVPPFPSDPNATPKHEPVKKEELQGSELRAWAFWESSPNPIFLKEKESRYLFVNREFEKVLRSDCGLIRCKKDPRVTRDRLGTVRPREGFL